MSYEFQAKLQSNQNRGDTSDPAGNFFAPFFDVVFYRPLEESGTIYGGDNTGEDAAAVSARLAEKREQAQTINDFGSSGTIGSSTLNISSESGSTQLLDPDGDLSQIRNFRSSLTIESLESSNVRAILTLKPPYADALQIIDKTLIRFGSYMVIQWGYLNADGGEPVLSSKGLFTIVEPKIDFGESVTIQIAGYDVSYMGSSSLDRRCVWPREQYKSDLDIVRKLVQHNIGDTYKIITNRVALNSPIRAEQTGNPWIQTEDDFSFMRKIIHHNDVGYRIDGTELQLFDYGRVDAQEPSYTLMMYRQPEKGTDIPMISFSANSDMGLFSNSQGSRGLFIYSHDLDNNAPIKRSLQPDSTGTTQVGTDRTSLGEGAHPKGSAKTSAGQAKTYNIPDDSCASGWIQVQPTERPSQEAFANSQNRAIRRANHSAHVVIPGHPGIKPLSIVEVFGDKLAGVGWKFGGNYRVMKVTHEIGQGYITKFDMLRSSSSGDSRDYGNPSDDPDNTKAASGADGESVEPTQSEASAANLEANSRLANF